MGNPDDNKHPQRAQTDESLRVERDKADAHVEGVQGEVDAQADEVLELARQRADELLRAAREDADRSPQTAVAEAAAEDERAQADAALVQERSAADGALGRERVERRRYLADFLASEREATDQDLGGERAQADTLVAARDEFLATVSHDLRTLLGGLSLSASLVLAHAPDGDPGNDLRRHAARSQRLVARMNRLVNDLLDVASIEAGKLALFPELVVPSRLVHDTLDAFEPVAAAKRIMLVADESPTGPAWLDDGRVLQVLANLVGNAIKFTPAEGRVTLRVGTDRREVHFSVSDTGVGISAADLPGTFERFRQVSKDPRGLGLGLHISKSIVEAHGGRMWAESEVGVGSTFFFALPIGVDGLMNS
jgi:signal transduction histidine kinase